MRGQVSVRLGRASDVSALRKLINDRKYLHIDFAVDELSSLVEKNVFMVATIDTRLIGFVYLRPYRRGSAVWDGAGVHRDFSPQVILKMLLSAALTELRELRITELFYIGDAEWLLPLLPKFGFTLSKNITLYEKADFAVPTRGNSAVRVRAATAVDIPAVAALDRETFIELWQLDEQAFGQILKETYYFSVALLAGRVVGYQCCLLVKKSAHLSRLAVHPAHQGRGIGARLLSDLISHLKREHVARITVNTQQDNAKSRRLYRWFGFRETGEVPVLRLEL